MVAKTGRLRLGSRMSLILSIVLVIGLSFPAWKALTPSGWYSMIDDIPAIFLFEMDRCFQDGQFPCRWNPDLAYGFGGPFLNFQAPLPSFVGELLHLLGLPILDSARYVFILGFLIAGLSMFLLAREFWGNLGGVVAGTFYVYAPYQAMDVYVRGAQREQWAIAILPLVFWGIYKVVKEGKAHHVLLLTLFVSLLLLSHQGVMTIAFPFAVTWALLLLWRTQAYRRILLLGLSGLWGFALAAFFTLPALLERDLLNVAVDSGRYQNYFDFHKHFAFWDQLFISRAWAFGPSLEGRGANEFSLQIGWLHWGVTAVSILFGLVFWRRHRAIFWVWTFFFLFFWVVVLMTNESSRLVWETFTPLKYLEFPWRYLALVIFASSFLAGSVLLFTRNRPLLSLLVGGALVAGVIGLNQEFFNVNQRFDITDEENFSGDRWDHQTSRLGGLVPWFEFAEVAPGGPAEADLEVLEGTATVTNIRKGSDSLAFAAETTTGARVRASIIDFPNWRVRVDGEVVDHDHDNPLGLITFDVPNGTHEVVLELENTGVRTFGNYLSLTGWGLFLLAWLGWAVVMIRRLLLYRAAAVTEAPKQKSASPRLPEESASDGGSR